MKNRLAKYSSLEPIRTTPAFQALSESAKVSATTLGALMCELSEQGVCAAWILGNEEALWAWLHGVDVADFYPRWGDLHGDFLDRAAAQDLHEECEGWIVWEEGGAHLPPHRGVGQAPPGAGTPLAGRSAHA